MSNTRYHITSASDKSISFDYQFYFYMFLILYYRFNEKIGIEVKDYIHIDFNDGRLILTQTKHTIKTKKKIVKY